VLAARRAKRTTLAAARWLLAVDLATEFVGLAGLLCALLDLASTVGAALVQLTGQTRAALIAGRSRAVLGDAFVQCLSSRRGTCLHLSAHLDALVVERSRTLRAAGDAGLHTTGIDDTHAELLPRALPTALASTASLHAVLEGCFCTSTATGLAVVDAVLEETRI
jgi:hypothetical protein